MVISSYAKVGIGWAVCTVLGISSFYLSKTSVTKKRYENMKVRERMRLANDTDYQPSYRKFSS